MFAFFIFGMECRVETYLWIFEKYADTAARLNGAIVFEEELGDNWESTWIYNRIKEVFSPLYQFSMIDQAGLAKLNHACITKEDKEKLFKNFEDEITARRLLVKEKNDLFEKIIEEKLTEIELKGGKIEAIFTFIWNPSLAACAERRGIPVITQEFSAVRGENPYSEIFGYFCFGSKYDSKQIERVYSQFEKDNREKLVLSRKELLALVLNTDNLDVLNRLGDALYEFGIDVGIDEDHFFHIYDGRSEADILEELNRMVDSKLVLARCHPAHVENRPLPYVVDHSPNALEWVLKCKRIVSVVSNLAFDAMLLGRVSYSLCENMPYYYKNVKDFSIIEDSPVDIRYVNYIMFGYLVPWELMFDEEYIRWRLTYPEPADIYEYNIKYVIEKNNISYESFIAAFPRKRLEIILDRKHHLSQEIIDTYVSQVRKCTYTELDEEAKQLEIQKKDLEKQKRDLEEHNHRLEKELNTLINSTSWKITGPIRRVMDFIKQRRDDYK